MERSPQFSRSHPLTGANGHDRASSPTSLKSPWPTSPTALPSSPTAFPVPLGSGASAPMFDRLDAQQPMFPDAQRDDYISSSNASASNASMPDPRNYSYVTNPPAQDRGFQSRSNFDNENPTEYFRKLDGGEAGERSNLYKKRMADSREQPVRAFGYYDGQYERGQIQEEWRRTSSSPKDTGTPPSFDFRRPHYHREEQDYARESSKFHDYSPRQTPNRAQEELHSPYGSRMPRSAAIPSRKVPPTEDYSDYYNDENEPYKDTRRRSSPLWNRARQEQQPLSPDSRDEESWKENSRDFFEGRDDFRAKPLDSPQRGRRKEQRPYSKTYDDDCSRSPDSPRVGRRRVPRTRSPDDWRHDSDDESSFDSARNGRWRERSSGRQRSKSKDRYTRTRSKSRDRKDVNRRGSRSDSEKRVRRDSFEKVKEKNQERVRHRQNKVESHKKGGRGYPDDLDLTSYSSSGTYERTSRGRASRYSDDDDDSSSTELIDENPTRRKSRHHKIYKKEEENLSESSDSTASSQKRREQVRESSRKKYDSVGITSKQQKTRERNNIKDRVKNPQQSRHEVSFSPSTDIPQEKFEILEEASSTCSSLEKYAQRISDAHRMKEQSEARHQILSEIRQATEMRRSATTDFDKRFWDKQIRTLNESLKKLFIQQGMVLNADSLLKNFEEMALEESSAAESETIPNVPVAPVPVPKATTIKVRAPEDLPEGHQFTVRVDGKPLTLKVPEGGVSKGDIFSIHLAQDGRKASGIPTPSTAEVQQSRVANSSLHSEDRQTDSNSNTVQVRAPAYLPAGYKFKVTHNGRQIIATVPNGGVQKGEVFVALIDEDQEL